MSYWKSLACHEREKQSRHRVKDRIFLGQNLHHIRGAVVFGDADCRPDGKRGHHCGQAKAMEHRNRDAESVFTGTKALRLSMALFTREWCVISIGLRRKCPGCKEYIRNIGRLYSPRPSQDSYTLGSFFKFKSVADELLNIVRIVRLSPMKMACRSGKRKALRPFL